MQGRDGGTFDVWRCQQLRKVSTFICLLQLHCPFIEGNACPVFSAWLFLTHAQPKPTKIKCSPPLFHIKIDSSLWKHRQLWWCCKLFLPRWVFLRKWKYLGFIMTLTRGPGEAGQAPGCYMDLPGLMWSKPHKRLEGNCTRRDGGTLCLSVDTLVLLYVYVMFA